MSEAIKKVEEPTPEQVHSSEVDKIKETIRALRDNPKSKWSEVAGRFYSVQSEEFHLVARKGLRGAHTILGKLTNKKNKLYGIRKSYV